MALESGAQIRRDHGYVSALIRDAAALGQMRARLGSWSAGWRWPERLMLPRRRGWRSRERSYLGPQNKLERASLYLFVAEQDAGARVQSGGGRPHMPGPALSSTALPTSVTSTASASKSHSPTGPCPLFTAARRGGGPIRSWCIATAWMARKELLYWSRLPEALARRGVSTHLRGSAG